MSNYTREDIERERAGLKARFGESYDRLEALLFEEDPLGINFGHNTDEYAPEVGTILPLLRTCRSVEDVQDVIHSEFSRWFDADIAVPRSHYRRSAERVFVELSELFALDV
ncbi:MAG: hypothetical protein ACOY0T_16540 [Myxococcota bacterium]